MRDSTHLLFKLWSLPRLHSRTSSIRDAVHGPPHVPRRRSGVARVPFACICCVLGDGG